MGIPIVSTHIGAEGLPVTHGKNILLQDEPNAFAQEVASLLNDPSRCRTIANSALRMVRDRYSWSAVSQIFESHLYTLLEGRKLEKENGN